MVVVSRFLWNHRSSEDDSDSRSADVAEPNKQPTKLLATDRSLLQMFIPKRDRGQWVPTLSGIVKAGDEGAFSSILFNSMQGHSEDLGLEQLYDAFANALRTRPTAERSLYSPGITKFISGTRQRARRTQSVKINKDTWPQLPPGPPRNSIDLAERGLMRSKSRKVSPVLISMYNTIPSADPASAITTHSKWTHELQHAQYFEGRVGINVTFGEISALSVILGSPITTTHSEDTIDKSEVSHADYGGALGISIHGKSTEDGMFHVSFKQHKRGVSHFPARGSGYSILFAKHFAAGSIPFSQEQTHVNSILLSADTYEAVQAGTALQLQQAGTATSGSKFLSSLPNSRPSNFHVLRVSEASLSTPLLLHVIADLPFTGGLPPMASSPIIKIVKFIASAGLPPARLLQRLEALVDKVHQHSPSMQLFGPLLEDSNAGLLFRERERLGKLATGALTRESTADKTFRMHRYVTLLERLMCLIPDMQPKDILAAVREATKKEIERSYQDAVAVFKHACESPTPFISHKRLSSGYNTRRASKRSSSEPAPTPTPTPPIPSSPTLPVAQVASPESPQSVNSPRSSSTFPVHNLGRQVEQILKAPLPFSVDMVAFIARMVLVAWTQSVEAVAWEQGEEGIRFPEAGLLPEKMAMW